VRPTLKEIARRSGVSIATVSRVLNDTDNVREQVKEKVWRVAKELGYRPPRSFRKRVGKSKVIALMITDIANPFFPEIVHGVEDAVFEHGFSVSLWNTREDPQREEHYLRTLHKENVKGWTSPEKVEALLCYPNSYCLSNSSGLLYPNAE